MMEQREMERKARVQEEMGALPSKASQNYSHTQENMTVGTIKFTTPKVMDGKLGGPGLKKNLNYG